MDDWDDDWEDDLDDDSDDDWEDDPDDDADWEAEGGSARRLPLGCLPLGCFSAIVSVVLTVFLLAAGVYMALHMMGEIRMPPLPRIPK